MMEFVINYVYIYVYCSTTAVTKCRLPFCLHHLDEVKNIIKRQLFCLSCPYGVWVGSYDACCVREKILYSRNQLDQTCNCWHDLEACDKMPCDYIFVRLVHCCCIKISYRLRIVWFTNMLFCAYLIKIFGSYMQSCVQTWCIEYICVCIKQITVYIKITWSARPIGCLVSAP